MSDDDDDVRRELEADLADLADEHDRNLADEIERARERRNGQFDDEGLCRDCHGERILIGEGGGTVPCPFCNTWSILPRVVRTTMSTVTPEQVRWLWRGWLPLGALSLLVGHPARGKSTLALLLAAEVSTGMLNGDLAAEPSDVLLISYEDHLRARLRPMVEAAGADLAKVHALACEHDDREDVLDLVSQLTDIEAQVVATGARMLLIDPLVAGLRSGAVDSHRDQSVRAVLAPLAAMAERRNLAVLATMHLSKQATSALLGAGGSVGFAAAARSILAFGLDPEDDKGEHGSLRILAHAKSNLGRLQPSQRVAIIETGVTWQATDITTSKAVITETAENVSADDLVRVGGHGNSPRMRAAKFLRQLLADGPHRAKEVIQLAEDDGISEKTLRRAADDIGVEKFQRERQWWWFLPDEDDDDDEASEVENGGDDE